MATIEPTFPLRALTIAFNLKRLRASPLLIRMLVTPRLPRSLVGSVDEDPAKLIGPPPGPICCAAIPFDPFFDPLELHELHELHEELAFDFLYECWDAELHEDDEFRAVGLLHRECFVLHEDDLHEE